jgi:tape measure domain-containing protein
MAAITAELALEVSKFQGALRQAQDSLRGFRSRARSQGSGLGTALFAGVGKAAAGLGPMLAGAVSVAAVGKVISGAIGRAANDEQLQVSFDVLVGDSTKAKETLASLRKLGTETPFEFPELAEAGKKLIAFGEGADTVSDTLRRIGDVSSGIQAPIGDIAEIYGKARVQGRLFAEDINQLTGRGIPVIQEFAKQLGVTDAEVKEMASSGQISFANLEQAFVSLTSEGGKFGGMMARQSRTVGGLWSTFKDTVGEVLLAFGQPINDALRPLLDEAIQHVGSLKEGAAQLGAAVSTAMKAVVGFFREFSGAEMGQLLLDSLVLAFKASVNVLYRGLVGTLAAMGQLIVEYFHNAVTFFSILTTADFWKGMGNALAGIAKTFGALLMELLAKAVEGLKQIPGAGKLLGNADGTLRDQARVMRESAAGNFTKSGDQLTPAFEAAQQRLGEALGNLGGAFTEAYGNTRDLFDTSKESSALGEAAARLSARLAADEARAAKEKEAQAAAAKAAPPAAPPTATASGATRGTARLAPGAFASAINLIMGRSANELILDETKKQTETQRQMAGQLKQINEKLTPRPQTGTAAAPVLPVDTVARFA